MAEMKLSAELTHEEKQEILELTADFMARKIADLFVRKLFAHVHDLPKADSPAPHDPPRPPGHNPKG